MASLGRGGVQLVDQLHGALRGRLQRGVRGVSNINILYIHISLIEREQINEAPNMPLLLLSLVFDSKCETSEMQDLVQMMTRTLRMDARDVAREQESSRCNSATLPEFKLNRKYRDTLMLHGKSTEGEHDFHLGDFRSG